MMCLYNTHATDGDGDGNHGGDIDNYSDAKVMMAVIKILEVGCCLVKIYLVKDVW